MNYKSNQINDPQDKTLFLWNKFLVLSCILAVYVDPLFFYIPVYHNTESCLKIHRSLAHSITTVRTIVDIFYLVRIGLQFRTAYIAPSSRVFGRGELVIDPAQIARRYMQRYFFVDILSVLPLPQVEVFILYTKKSVVFFFLVILFIYFRLWCGGFFRMIMVRVFWVQKRFYCGL